MHFISIAPSSSPTLVTGALLGWIERTRRDLPWRRDRSPYAVWISEIMLQQTQVATVAPYFQRWMVRFPDVETLAEADQGTVLKMWEGLGYYARARNLHRTARLIVSRYGGQVPADRAALLALPGIGRYTVGAILSLAFGRHEPVLDGNVRRVLCRVYDIDTDPRGRETEKRLWSLATDLVTAAPPGRAGDLNEALMELGALVCTPGRPDCPLCPLAGGSSGEPICLARARNVEVQRPIKTPRRKTPHHNMTAAVVRNAGSYLIVQRPQAGLLGGLWGFPGGVADPGESLPMALASRVSGQTGIHIEVGEPLLQIQHAYTHFRITLHVFHATYVSGEARPLTCADARWAPAAELAGYPFPVTDGKILSALGLA